MHHNCLPRSEVSIDPPRFVYNHVVLHLNCGQVVYLDRYRKPTEFNEAPRSKLRGITELKHPELPELFLRLPLPLHIPFDSLPVCPFPYRGHIVPVGPKLPAPQDPLHCRLSAKDLPRRDALDYLHNPAWRHFRMRTAEPMAVNLVRPHRFPLDWKPFRNLCRRLLDNRRYHLIEQGRPVFHGKDNLVVALPRRVRSLSNGFVPLVRHTPEGTRKDCPHSKLRGITSSTPIGAKDSRSPLNRIPSECPWMSL
jgi:hypothetical protein